MTPPAGDAAYGAAGNAAAGCTYRSSSLSAWVSSLTNPRHVTGRGRIAAAGLGSSSTSTGRRDLMHEGLQAHHVVAQQELRRTAPAELWNVLVGMGVCGLVHRQHHNRIRPILLREIPPVVAEYLYGLGFGAYLARRYPVGSLRGNR